MDPKDPKDPKRKNQTGGPNRRAGPVQNQSEGAENDPLFFYMTFAKFGEFSQWHPSTFTVSKAKISKLVGRAAEVAEPDGDITFNCAEQFMMYCKAARFGDAERQARILATLHPKEQKQLGRGTQGFTHASWDEVKSRVVEAGNIAKFEQNPSLRWKLLATGDRLLCEAASKDRVWGIGYSEKHAMTHRMHWGENRLGKALMVARTYLRRVRPR